MKRLFPTLAIILAFCADAQERTLQTTAKTREFLRASTAAEARQSIGITDSSVGTWSVVSTPWAVTGNLSTSAVPWRVYTTLIASNNGYNSHLPVACYDFARRRIVAAFSVGDGHYSTNGVIHFVDSYDGGLTWKNERVITAFGTNVPQVGLTVLEDGTMLANVIHRIQTNSETYYGPLIIFESSDGGNSWSTNSVIGSMTKYGVDEIQWQGSQSVFTTGGYWMISTLGLSTVGTLVSPKIWYSSDRGQNWTSILLNPLGNEIFMAQHPNGTLYAVLRTASAFDVYTSTNVLNWEKRGTLDMPGMYSVTPSFVFMGERMMFSLRTTTFGTEAYFYSDAAETHYTNGWQKLYGRPQVAAHAYPVKLSESVVLWVTSYYDTFSALDPNGSRSNAWVQATVIANDGFGYSQSVAIPPAVIDLRSAAIPAVGDRLTKWPNYGTLGLSPTNDANFGPGPLSTGSDLLWFSTRTNSVTFGVSNAVPSLWQTNRGAVVWRISRTNSADRAFVIDNHHESIGVGFSVKHYGDNVYVKQGNGSAQSGSYAMNAGTYASGSDNVYALRWEDGIAELWKDGFPTSSTRVTNAGNAVYSTAANALQRLTVGAYGNSGSGTNLFLGALMVFTNPPTDAELLGASLAVKKK